jgi:hypothetical protein
MSADPFHSSNPQIVTNGNMSITIISSIINLNEVASYSVQAVYTGTPAGSIKLQGSNDIMTSSGNPPTNWTDITDSVSDISTAGSYLINVEIPTYSWVRLVYSPTGGSGTLNARVNTKRR